MRHRLKANPFYQERKRELEELDTAYTLLHLVSAVRGTLDEVVRGDPILFHALEDAEDLLRKRGMLRETEHGTL